ncbi:hypothetical protein LK12_21855 [Novosphingobium malaysiense]|uniref:HTH araC/xylS-type domain-containing protein n=2 Tax=Novosphingobium malaysiense TaxID=1348853 RepID=A0A0B1ZFA8_9SPHN|nr:hypothetical protein LK12_21855 [Novosphingobium malaysiense]
MGSVGAVVDGFEMARSYVRRQYGAVDILPASDRFDVVDLRLLAPGKDRPATEGGHLLPMTGSLDETPCDVVFVADCAADQADREDRERGHGGELGHWLKARRAEGAIIGASGEGIALLAANGLLEAIKATAPVGKLAEWHMRWPRVRFEPGKVLIEDANIVTSQGGVYDQELAVTLVTAVTSANTGRWLASRLGITRTALAGDLHTQDYLIERAKDWLVTRFSQKVSIEDLACAMGVHRRTLHRHFQAETGMSPVEYLQSLRVEASKRMLERSPFTIERIAALVGYSDAGFYRTAFRRATGTSPRHWRARHRQDQSSAGEAG